MNIWNMSNRANSLKWADRGGYAVDAGGEMNGQTYKPSHQYSIHPQGRTPEHREKQRRIRAKTKGK